MAEATITTQWQGEHGEVLRRDLRMMRRALLAYSLVLGLKLVAYGASGAVVLLAEALQSLSDILITVFLLVAMRVSMRAADESHVFGHARAQNLAALVGATLLIGFTTFQVYREAIPLLWRPHDPERNLWFAVAVLLVSMVISAWPLVGLLRHRERGPTAKAQMVDLLNDQLSLLTGVVGLLFVAAGYPLGDPIAAMLIGVVIGWNAVALLRENFTTLMGRSPDEAYLERLHEAARSVPGVVSTHGLMAEFIGPKSVRASMHVMVPPGMTIEDADHIAEEVQRRMVEVPECHFAIVHLDAAGSDGEHVIGDGGPEHNEGESEALPPGATSPGGGSGARL
jgi:ferrous-iron efflux pump FieF